MFNFSRKLAKARACGIFWRFLHGYWGGFGPSTVKMADAFS